MISIQQSFHGYHLRSPAPIYDHMWRALKSYFAERKSNLKTGFLLFAYGDVIILEFIQHSFLFSVSSKKQPDNDVEARKSIEGKKTNRNSSETPRVCDEHT